MNFPQFWAKGSCGDFSCWGWSVKSRDEAQALADQAAARLADRFRVGDLPAQQQTYYPSRPFREQVLREIRNSSGDLVGLVTRNSYGCLVLNTAKVMFVDVDLPQPKPAGGLFKRLFGLTRDGAPAINAEHEAVAKAENWTRSHPDWGWRVYRTRAGLRLLATHALFDPDLIAQNGVFSALGADPLYRQLCVSQKCFRARLTPKPWRCGIYQKPERWPWLTPKAEMRFKKWEAEYQSKSTGRATCELVCHIGSTRVHPDVELVIGTHDKATLADTTGDLA